VELFVARTVPAKEAPFAREQFAWLSHDFVWRNDEDLNELDAELERFKPDVLVIVGWEIPAYRRIARKWKGRAMRVLTMDNQWLGTTSQWIGRLTAPFFVQKLADAMWVPGERQAAFAKRLGFSQSQILRGHLCCDFAAFDAVREARKRRTYGERCEFVFIGRMIETKGVTTLASAYRKYRSRTKEPWPLVCYGTGPMKNLLESEPGIIVEGFVQPGELPARLGAARCLVLPSLREPWGMVIQEAAAAGLVILASDAVGAVPHLVQPNYNGFIFDVGDEEGLAGLFERVSKLSDERLEMMSEASSLLARQFTPVRWANTLMDYYANPQKSAPTKY
jgi:glycosyltransferase involved in cell wall biosynthesis